MVQGLGDWEDALGDDAADEMLPALEWEQMSAGSSLPGFDDDTSLYDESPISDELRVTEFGASPWGPGAGEGYQPWAQAQTDSPPLGDPDDGGAYDDDDDGFAPSYGSEIIPALNAHPDVDPATIYDRSSYEPPTAQRKTYGAGIFDLEDQGATFNQDDGIFANNYALPDYLAREPELDVFESEALDVNTGLPRVVQPSASGVQLMRDEPGRLWSPFAPPPYGTSTPMNTQPYAQPTLHNYGSSDGGSIEAFGKSGARAILEEAARRCPHDANQRGAYICQMLDQMMPNLSPRALAAVARLRGANFPGPAIELVVAHCLMYVAECDLNDLASGRSRRLERLSRSPVLGPAASSALGPAARQPGAAANQFRASRAGGTAKAMLGQAEAPATASNGTGATDTPWLKYGLGLSALGLVGYFGYDWWKKQQKKGTRASKTARNARERT